MKRLGVLAPLAAVCGAMAAFQTSAALAHTLFATLGPPGTATLRLGLGALMLVALRRPWRSWPRQAPLGSLLGLGASMGGEVLLFYLAQSRLPLGVAIALQFLGPLTVAVLGSRRLTDLVWVALAAFGVWRLVGVGGAGLHVDLVGVGWALGAAVCWAGYILCGRQASAAFGQATLPLAAAIAAALVLPVGVWQAGAALLTPTVMPMALLVAVTSVVLPFSLELYALPRLPVRTFATFTSLEPAFGVMAGWAMLDQRLAVSQIAGVAMVIVAAAGAAWSSRRGERTDHADIADTPPD